MAWKIVGIITGRDGSVAFLPEWATAEPGTNTFTAHAQAMTVRDAMAQITEKEKLTLRYAVVPVIDEALLQQLRGEAPQQQRQPPVPALSFGTPPQQQPQ